VLNIFDTSNHKNMKLVPVLVQHVTPDKRVQTKVIEFRNLKGKVAILISYIMNVLHKYNLSDNIIAFCGNKSNTNFGGAARRGTVFLPSYRPAIKNSDKLYRMCRPYFA
jgi:hypothetical protein